MRVSIFVVVALGLLASCKKTPMDRVEGIRDELVGDAPRWSGDLPTCANRETCTTDVATAIGGTFDDKKPDQITAAIVAIVVARDHHAADVGSPDVWLTAISKAKGPGADAMRLAVALDMSSIANKHGRAIDSDADAKAFVADVAGALPGACKTYELLKDKNADDLSPVDSPDHSACVQHDLSRATGPGAAYGFGLFRAAAGALALWKAELAALKEGSAQMNAKYKEALDRRVALVDAATAKILLRHVDAPAGNTWNQMLDEHRAPLK